MAKFIINIYIVLNKLCNYFSICHVPGEVFLNAFSKAVVLDVYSDFINNFSVAMELAKMESKRKSALADFLKVKQISAHDRLSFFGLMVKPVQRFPQFIMFLQVFLFLTVYDCLITR